MNSPRSILLTLGVFLVAVLHAGVTVVSGRLEGPYSSTTNTTGIATGQALYLQDDQYAYMLANPSWTSVFTDCSLKNRITLKYEESARVYYATPWTLTVNCTLKKWNSSGVAITPDETFTLSINYDPAAGTSYIDKDIYTATAPGYKTQVIVGTITFTGSISAVPADVLLEEEIEVERSYVFTQLSAPPQIANGGVNTTEHTLNISWGFLSGAEEYDLEWLHVSSYDPVSVATPDFTRATRITTPNQSYTINLPYDDGYVLYRVRGAATSCDQPGFRKEGVWSSASSQLAVSNIDAYRNWQYNAMYAEDGKRKETISFYDGTGKPRQAVTLNNTENAVLVGETMYDYEGRPAIQTLPAPEERHASILQYYTSFSLVSITNVPYNRKAFDKDALYNSSTCNWGMSPGMSTTEGASNYYSPSNQEVSNGMYAALPDAKEYPFVQTVYGRDGRPVKQSAPGADHNIGSGQETEMYYTTPTQQKLDRMFGNEVGYAEHYNQVTNEDANGQLSVVYMDLSGRTIATSLIGQAPSAMDPLASNQSITLAEDFNNSNVYDAATGMWLVNSFYMVNDVSSIYTFTYTMTPEEFQSLCTSQNFNCVYDLEINIYDACDNKVNDQNNPHVLGTPYVITYQPSYSFTQTFTVSFPRIGVYRVEKKLTLNQAALNAAVASFQAALPGTCFETEASIETGLNNALDLTECVGCDSSCTLAAIALGLTGTAKQNFIDSCRAHDCATGTIDANTCGDMLAVFAGDLAPGGQYFDNIPSGSSNAPSDAWMTANAWLNSNSTAWTNADFRKPDGTLIQSWSDMRTYWQTGWATRTFTTTVTIGTNTYNRLVEFHPEYCHYGWCTSMTAARQWDVDMFASDLIAWAQANPAAPALPYINLLQVPVGLNVLNQDPYYAVAPGNGDYAAMLGQLNNYNATGMTMWAYAGVLAGCGGCNAQWVMFRTLYISVKAQHMRARENTACGFLCDNTLPPDFVADAPCAPANTQGFMIRIPDLVAQLSAQPAAGWGANGVSLINCNTAASTSAINMVSIIGGASTVISNCVQVNYGTTDITCGLFCGNGSSYTSAQIAAHIVAAINACVSSPDFTAAVDPANASQLFIYAPASVGSAANGWQLQFVIPSPNPTNIFSLSGGVSNTSGVNCLTQEHCFCQQLYQLEQFYNATNPNSSFTGNFIVDHSLYPNGVDQYMASALNTAFGTSVTTADVTAWKTSCNNTSRANPRNLGTEPVLPAALDCANPANPCVDDAYDITDYYGNLFYQQLVEQATQDFITDYIEHCFGGDFSEDFDVSHPDREYHFTLYYYDQAGALVRTVPPAGVKLLNATQVQQAADYRNGVPLSTRTVPDHRRSVNNMVTNYKYNSFNKLVESASPDGGTTTFFYDKIGRILASRNAKQAAMSNYVYSYTLYDAQSRPYEVGQVESTTQLTSTNTASMSAFLTWVAAGTRTQVTSTYYDVTLNTTVNNLFSGGQKHLRKRVASVTIEQTYDGNSATYDHATHYNYDVLGNVNHLVNDYPQLTTLSRQYTHLYYRFDVISGNVNEVQYQPGEADQYYHRYYYDADNRVANAYTSRNGIVWEQDAKYLYYLHGPVGRSEIGDVKVQGQDYAYTIHGWIKGVNSNVADRTKDLGKDGQATNSTTYIAADPGIHSNTAIDAFGYTLGYYWNTSRKDYQPINTSAQSLYNDATTLSNASDDLYNGNIKEMATALMQPNGTGLPTLTPLIFNRYHYDQLNRIKSSNSYTGASTTGYATLTNTAEFKNTFTYDANGNIQAQFRNGNSTSGLSMDNLTYKYYTTTGGTVAMNADGTVPTDATNKLAYVDDTGTPPTNYLDDIEDQASGNYTYDAIGNLISDFAEGIATIEWNVYGKISKVTRSTGSLKSDLEFYYDAMGQRVLKIEKPRTAGGIKNESFWMYTYYQRDPQGNVMAVYERKKYENISQYVDELKLKESHLYGSARLGIREYIGESGTSAVVNYPFTGYNGNGTFITGTEISHQYMPLPSTTSANRKLGKKMYEFTNHLGNVLVTLSDRKLLKQQGSSSTIDYFMASVRSTSDYSPFGAPMPGRNFSSGEYRYGFNGKENDPETTDPGEGLQDYGMRIYNPALGRFLSVDPIAKEYPWNSTYAFAENDVVRCIDLEGAEKLPTTCPQQVPTGEKGKDWYPYPQSDPTAMKSVRENNGVDPNGNQVYSYEEYVCGSLATVYWYIPQATPTGAGGVDVGGNQKDQFNAIPVKPVHLSSPQPQPELRVAKYNPPPPLPKKQQPQQHGGTTNSPIGGPTNVELPPPSSPPVLDLIYQRTSTGYVYFPQYNSEVHEITTWLDKNPGYGLNITIGGSGGTSWNNRLSQNTTMTYGQMTDLVISKVQRDIDKSHKGRAKVTRGQVSDKFNNADPYKL